MKKIVVFQKGIESVAYFSARLAETFEAMGYAIFYYELDLEDPREQQKKLKKFVKAGETFVISFNFNGLRGEEEFYEQGELIWKRWRIPFINIMVDHPFYYPKLLDKMEEELGWELYYQVAIDRDHEKFMRRFYPQIQHLTFFPLAGSESPVQVSQKEYDVVFVGNYTPPERFRKYIDRIDEEYTAFYEGIIADLIQHPHLTMEAAFEKHLKREMGPISDEDLRTCMGNMIFLDLYVRFYFRGEIVKTIAEAGIPIHIWGGGFELLDCKKPENMILEGPTDSAGCLQALAKGKIALNVMPWFKDGSHDRIYSAMCNHAVCLTDDSVYLREELEDGKQVVFYSLKDFQTIPQQIRQLLADDRQRGEIAQHAYAHVMEHHVWSKRVEHLISFVET